MAHTPSPHTRQVLYRREPTSQFWEERRCRKPDHLSFGLGRFGESAELGEAHEEPATVEDRWRGVEPEVLGDPLGRQRGEVVGGQRHNSLGLAPEMMRLLKIGRGGNAESRVF